VNGNGNAAPALPGGLSGGGGSSVAPAFSSTLGGSNALGQHALLTHLVLAGNPIGDAGAEVLFRLVGTGDSPLELLDVSGCRLAERSAVALQNLLEGAR